MEVEYFPTEMIIADFYTKPFQGKLFRLFRKKVKSAHECVVGNDKFGSLNMVKHDVGSDNSENAVDTRKIISRVKP